MADSPKETKVGPVPLDPAELADVQRLLDEAEKDMVSGGEASSGGGDPAPDFAHRT
jgi:hypothetical protein